jgi:drug/metabolite transporter (DMT)-like permease
VRRTRYGTPLSDLQPKVYSLQSLSSPVSHLAFLLCCFVWGGSFILMDRASHALGPVTIGMGRMAGGALAIGLYCLWKRQWTRLTLADLGHLTVVSILANVYPYVIQPYVMRQAGEHGFFGMMMAFVPLATIAVSIPTLGVWPTARQLTGVLGGLACMALIVYDGSHRGMPLRLLVLAISTPISYALGNTYLKWKVEHLPAAPLAATFLAIGALLLVPLQLATGLLARLRLSAPPQPYDWPLSLAALVLLGVMGTGICVLIFVHLVKSRGPLYAGMVTYIIPLVALLWGQFDGERLTPVQAAAMAGVLAMVALVQWSSTPRQAELLEPAPEPPA